MLEFGTCLKETSRKRCRIDVSEEIDVNKTNASKECDICRYWYFKGNGFKSEPYLCNGCHDLMQKAISFKDVAIIYVKESAYKIHFWYMSKDDAISIMNDSNLMDKKGVFEFFLLYIKMSDLTYYERNRDVILNRVKDYYENDKERLREQARDKYRNLSEEEKNKKRDYGKNRYHNMSEKKRKTKRMSKKLS